ncbi:F0F1 ATP synthase subunit gamma [Candidatus Ishikawella capsulata]|uniref:ATP synthase gamma chain n=1 Tax=Candidatus Ishikawaella capsulata Mpkobe TaxID=476281 RepID=C5WC24_9ENTR|nr:F0F1 ATP synthase subunit gamma [Candidatus Ishikawaella capsulata]BAH82880.1 F0F1 ATP synthase subunit gamma [Candidatus Ishikawaella capsulata Mpkobe]
MVSPKEIRNKIYTVKNMQKITKAMEMVAVSKMRKTQERLISSRPYTETILQVINHLASANLEYKHNYLQERKVKRVGYLLISTDRGLCGGLNHNLFKKILLEMQNWFNKGVASDLAIIGSKGLFFFNIFKQANIIAKLSKIGDNPTVSKLIGIVQVMLKAYDDQNIDKLYLAYNKFNNSISQTPIITQLLPFSYLVRKKKNWDYLYEPNSKSLLDILLYRYVESQVYHGVLENIASEQAARMVAMKSATENGSNIIKDLELMHHKARQSSITQELTEIISGASTL